MKVIMLGPPNLGPYHFARFRSAAKLMPTLTYVKVRSKPSKQVYRPWSADLGGVPCRILDLKQGEDVTNLLHKEKPDTVVVIGYGHRALLQAASWAKKHDVLSILQSDSTRKDRSRNWWKERGKFFIVKHLFDAAFVAGVRSAMYVNSLGIPENTIWCGVNVVDNEHFAQSRDKWVPPGSFPEQHFLTVTRLSPEKNVSRLLQAFELYRRQAGRWGLVIAGTGPQERVLKKNTPKDLINCVYWYGWANYNDLPSLYQSASCFILPSVSESWGIVVNEAMAACLPVLVSSNCGCSPELCQIGVNGYEFDPFNANQLAELMLKMSLESSNIKAMGDASRKIISNYTPEIWATTLVEIIETLLNNEKPN